LKYNNGKKLLLMKRFLFILICLAVSIYTHGQIIIEFTKDKNKSRATAKVQIIGGSLKGDTTWQYYLENNLNASMIIGKGAKKGKYTVIIQYIVAKDGTICDVMCKNDPGYEMGNEAVRLVKRAPKWRASP
jgi:hypothetical protein